MERLLSILVSTLAILTMVVFTAEGIRADTIVVVRITGSDAIPETPEFDVQPGTTNLFNVEITNLSTDGESIWLDSLSITPPTNPLQGSWTVLLSLPNVGPSPPSGFVPPLDLSVAPGETLFLPAAAALTVNSNSFSCTFSSTRWEFGLGTFKFPLFFLGVSREEVNLTTHTTNVPEPATMLLLGTGIAGIAIKTRKRLKQRKSRHGSQ